VNKALQRRVYKHASERNGARVMLYAVKRVEHDTRPCPASQGAGLVPLKCGIDVRKLAGNTARRKAS